LSLLRTGVEKPRASEVLAKTRNIAKKRKISHTDGTSQSDETSQFNEIPRPNGKSHEDVTYELALVDWFSRLTRDIQHGDMTDALRLGEDKYFMRENNMEKTKGFLVSCLIGSGFRSSLTCVSCSVHWPERRPTTC